MNEEKTASRIATSHGLFSLDAEHDKKMATALQRGEYPNEVLLAVAHPFVNSESVVIDIGAHIGTFAVPLAKWVKKVIAFEPAPEAFAFLSQNAALNNVRLELLNKGLGSKKGSGTLVVRKTSNAGANTLEEGGDIPITTLDDEVSSADFIKIDVEGMELEVLSGGMRLIERARPIVLFEVNLSQLRAHRTSPRALERFFTKRKYRLYISLGQKHETLARISSVTLLTACTVPRAWLFFGESSPFDLIAIPEERALPHPCVGFIMALFLAVKHNLSIKARRLRSLLY